MTDADRVKRMTEPAPGMLPDGTLNVVSMEFPANEELLGVRNWMLRLFGRGGLGPTTMIRLGPKVASSVQSGSTVTIQKVVAGQRGPRRVYRVR